MDMETRYDVIIIGTGAGGGTLAHRLAPSGKRILLLERGDYVRREPANWSSRAVNVEARYHTTEVWRDTAGAELRPHTNYYVGGNTKFYGAALFRLRREDFGELKHWGERRRRGRSRMRTSSPTTRRPSACTRSTARAARTRRTRRRARPTRGRP